MSLGQVLDPPPPTAPAKGKVAFSFVKNATADGVYGIIIYHVCDVNNSRTCKVAILFSVPFSRASYVNTFRICVLRHDEDSSAELLFQTNSGKMETATGSEVIVEDLGYVVKATMSETASAIMKVEMFKKNHS